MKQQVIGSWKLESFVIEKKGQGERPWGKNIRGLLIYAPTGHVSVAINKDQQEDSNADKAVLDSILFYAGTFTVEGDLIRHNVTIASSPSRVGREMLRYANVSGDTLTLRTPEESYGVATLTWRRLA